MQKHLNFQIDNYSFITINMQCIALPHSAAHHMFSIHCDKLSMLQYYYSFWLQSVPCMSQRCGNASNLRSSASARPWSIEGCRGKSDTQWLQCMHIYHAWWQFPPSTTAAGYIIWGGQISICHTHEVPVGLIITQTKKDSVFSLG